MTGKQVKISLKNKDDTSLACKKRRSHNLIPKTTKKLNKLKKSTAFPKSMTGQAPVPNIGETWKDR